MKSAEVIEFTSRTRGLKAIIKQHELVENAMNYDYGMYLWSESLIFKYLPKAR